MWEQTLLQELRVFSKGGDPPGNLSSQVLRGFFLLKQASCIVRIGDFNMGASVPEKYSGANDKTVSLEDAWVRGRSRWLC